MNDYLFIALVYLLLALITMMVLSNISTDVEEIVGGGLIWPAFWVLWIIKLICLVIKGVVVVFMAGVDLFRDEAHK
jgi:heme/copper-type cytochrome/quinol oxidase subunit 2